MGNIGATQPAITWILLRLIREPLFQRDRAIQQFPGGVQVPQHGVDNRR